MTTYTIYADTSDGYLQSSNAAYATARSGGGGLTAYTTGSIIVGQSFYGGATYYIFEGFLGFDTSPIGAGSTVTAATLSLDGQTDNSTTDFTIEAWSRDWGTAITTADWVAGASLSGLTLVASYASSGFTFVYNDFTSEAAFLAAINLTGYTRILLASAKTNANTAPTGDEYITFRAAEASGTSQDPKLVVIATSPITGTLTATLGDFTLASTATVAVAGTLTATLGDFTLASTIITESPGEIWVKHNGAWQEPTPWVKHNDSWVQPVATYVNQSGTWKRVQ